MAISWFYFYCCNCLHSDSECWISFVNWFWHLIIGNRSIVLNFYQERPVFALKIHPRPQRPTKGRKVQNFLCYYRSIQCKIIYKCEYNTKKYVFKNQKFSFSTSYNLKLNNCNLTIFEARDKLHLPIHDCLIIG